VIQPNVDSRKLPLVARQHQEEIVNKTFLNNNSVLIQFKTGVLTCFDLNGRLDHKLLGTLYGHLSVTLGKDQVSILTESFQTIEHKFILFKAQGKIKKDLFSFKKDK
jgi:hypothetical protein